MNKSFLFVIIMVAASFTGCIDSEDSDEILTDPVGEVNVPGNALVFTRDADATECSNGGITLDVGVDEDGDGKLNATETFNTSTICNGADGIDGSDGVDGSSCSAFESGNGTYTVSCTDGTSFTVSDGQQGPVGEKGDSGEDYTRSNTTLLTRVDDPLGYICEAGGISTSYGLDNGDGNGSSANGNLEVGEVDYSTTLCSTYEVGLLVDMYKGSTSSQPSNFFQISEDEILFTSDSSLGVELFSLNSSTMIVELLKDINPGISSSNPSQFVFAGDKIFFTAYTDYDTIWRTDGTTEGTVQIFESEGWLGSLSSFNGDLYFTQYDSGNGSEPWKYDISEDTTTMLKDINQGSSSSSPGNYFEFDNFLYFSARTAEEGIELWRTDGSSDGTYMVKDLNEGQGSGNPYNFITMNDLLFFSATDGNSGYELWKTDGTYYNTEMVIDLQEGASSGSPREFTVMNGELYFSGIHWNESISYGRELFKTDGTEEGTIMVKDINEGTDNSHPNNFILANDLIYFTAFNPTYGSELWVTDGTTDGTKLVKDINPGQGCSSYMDYQPTDDVCHGTSTRLMIFVHNDDTNESILYFGANDGSFGYELWSTQGTSDTTILVSDIAYGSSDGLGSCILLFDDFYECRSTSGISIGSTIIFGADDGYLGHELYTNHIPVTKVFYDY